VLQRKPTVVELAPSYKPGAAAYDHPLG
jgi:hypothetical protein